MRELAVAAFLAIAMATALAAAVAQPANAAPGPISVGTDGFARFDVIPDSGAAQVWVEIEEPGLTSAAAVIRLGNVSQTVSTTVFGVIAIVPASTSTQSFAVAITTAASPVIAVTVVDGAGTILSSESYQVTLVDYRTVSQDADGAGLLAITGFQFLALVAMTVFGGLVTLAGLALRFLPRSRRAA
jgi:hypothetical protein